MSSTDTPSNNTPYQQQTQPPRDQRPDSLPDERNNNDDTESEAQEILLAKRMFFGGLLGLPWLWICNVLYFRRKVYGPLRFIDYWPGRGSGGDVHANDVAAAGTAGGTTRGTNATVSKELETWVGRSTLSAFLVMTLFAAWIVAFQVNKDNFGSGWFVMSESEEEKTNW
mmetsp:Transcript_14215/g.29868  ORF Transcript_14215/g.29868 Transcript_14215/m.29868 type:complete len:169 (+) Transcript_14215:286-792(+)|eukprot:CAMPEP_0171337248 /NCGR_PEP_ID=MMETSP0878-20121228/6578_1 /TAXON_ID=67004 /ORGANISM="Thalassiosira weissflogii, Strain CCMP1336" /LENGTH=168 /DNA_ID=CAMNT_0011838859 /DNA_START=290 /DNA_END=796 /DNA_ORIENTATION=+